MKKNGFTFLEMLVVLFIVGMLTILTLGGFKHTRAAHRVDSCLQELTLLRTAILSYKEVHGNLPEIETSALSSDNFNALKPFWYPFHPENSKIIEGSSWWGKIGSDSATSFLAVKQGDDYVSFDAELLAKKMQGLCRVDNTGTYFYIFEPYSN